MKALKILVFTLAGLLILGFGVLIWGVTTRTHIKAPVPVPVPQSASVAPISPPAQTFGLIDVPLPPNGKVEQVFSAGPLIVMRVTVGAEESLTILDPASGQVRGEFRLGVPQK